MIASRASWRFAWLAAALLVGAVVSFALAGHPPETPDLVLPHVRERIDDGPRSQLRPRVEPEPRGVLDDSLVDRPRASF